MIINKNNNPEYLNSFLDYSETILNKSPNTIKEYYYDLNYFLRFIKKRFNLTRETNYSKITIKDISLNTIKKIKLEDIHAFLSYLTKTYNSKPATRARKVSSIRVFFKYLSSKAKLISTNPAQNLETPKLDKRLPKYLTLDESKKLLNAVFTDDIRNKERDFAIITLFLNCGLRLSELVQMNIKDINFNEKKVHIIGKGNKERSIYLNNSCMDAINMYLKTRPENKKMNDKQKSKDALFLSERRTRISKRTVQYIVNKELTKAELDTSKFSVHKLRHTAATLMYQYGHVDIRALQAVLGHESISTTEIYTHVSDNQIKNAIDKNPLNE